MDGKYGGVMNKYICVIILCGIIGCVSNPDIKKNNNVVEVKKDNNVKKDLLFYFWVVTGGM
jgi:uncharacterized protein (DUF2147 family)